MMAWPRVIAVFLNKREAEHQGSRMVGQQQQRAQGYTLKMEERP